MSNFIPTGFYLKIEFVEIRDEQRVISNEDHDEIIEAAGISGKIKDIHQMVSAIVTFTDFCKKNNIEFDLIAYFQNKKLFKFLVPKIQVSY